MSQASDAADRRHRLAVAKAALLVADIEASVRRIELAIAANDWAAACHQVEHTRYDHALKDLVFRLELLCRKERGGIRNRVLPRLLMPTDPPTAS